MFFVENEIFGCDRDALLVTRRLICISWNQHIGTANMPDLKGIIHYCSRDYDLKEVFGIGVFTFGEESVR